MTKQIIDEIKLEKALAKLSSVSHPKRMAIIEMLSEKEKMNVTQIYKRLNIEQAAASHHLSLMKSSKILEAKRKGKEIYYSINYDNLNHLNDCINLCAE